MFVCLHHRNFPNSTLRGNGELGDNNQVQVALVSYLWLGKIIGGKLLVGWFSEWVRLRVQYISLGVQIIRYGLGIR